MSAQASRTASGGRALRNAALGVAASVAIVAVAWTGASDAPVAPPAAVGVDAGADDAVLERLPGGAAESRALAALRERIAAGPGDAAAAIDAARRHLAAARANGDAREAGRAEAALARWRDDPQAPSDVRLLRSAALQHRHAFEEALADLDALLAREPDHPQALWQRAAIRRVVGELDAAADDCGRLDGLIGAASPVAAVCLAELAALRGDRDAAARLERRLAVRPPSAIERGWVALVQAEIADREGRDVPAERRFVQAIAADTATPYARVAYADWLVARGRWSDADAVLRDAPDTDAVRVLRAIAWRGLGDARADAEVRMLRARFAAARAGGGGTAHRREHARFLLDVEGDAPAALAEALRHWDVQKEPADARLLVRAAAAADRPDAAAPVSAFVAANRIADAGLARR